MNPFIDLNAEQKLEELAAYLKLNIIERLGGGSFGEVYRYHDPQLDAILAVKAIPKRNFPAHSGSENFFKEAKILYNAQHKHIVRIQYAVHNVDMVFLAMPFYKHGSLRKWLKEKDKDIRICDFLKYALQFLLGLNHIHVKGLIHFDIKPDNLMVGDNGDLLVSDFGLAKFISNFGTASPSGNTLPYMAPEALKASEVTAQFDIYSAGLTLYSILVGVDAYEKKFEQMQGVHFDDWQEFLQKDTFVKSLSFPYHIPEKLKKIIIKAISPNPINRYRTVLEMMNDLAEITENLYWKATSAGYAFEKDELLVNVCVQNKGEKFNIETIKNSRKVKENCLENLSEADLNKHLLDIFQKFK